MPKKKTTARSARRPPGGHSRPGEWQLVRVNQRPLRRKAASECSRELAKVEKIRAEWQRFDREDKPAFDRWMAVTFGALLTQLRDSESALREKELLVQEVEVEYCHVGARSYRAAYLAVMRRRNATWRVGDPEPPPEAEPEDEPKEVPEAEQRVLFEAFLREFLDIDPDGLARREYHKMFAEFQADMFGSSQRKPSRRPPKPKPKAEDSRLKEAYRVLVRRLHPDTLADNNPEVSAVWHEVQDAYLAGNVERLEMLLALTDLRSKSAGEQTSLYQMRELLAELRRNYLALQKCLRAARKDAAWNFSRGANREKVQARLQRQFDMQLAALEKRRRECESRLARWSRPLKSGRLWLSDLQVEFRF
jgi:hypothetical protein